MEKVTVIQLFSKDFYIVNDTIENITNIMNKDKFLSLGYATINISGIETVYEKDITAGDLVLISAEGHLKNKYMKLYKKLEKEGENKYHYDFELVLLNRFIKNEHYGIFKENEGKLGNYETYTNYLIEKIKEKRNVLKSN